MSSVAVRMLFTTTPMLHGIVILSSSTTGLLKEGAFLPLFWLFNGSTLVKTTKHKKQKSSKSTI